MFGVAPDDLRAEMRAFGKLTEADIERAIAVLIEGGAAPHVVGARPIKSESYLGFADRTGRRIAWLHVHFIDVVPEYTPPSGFVPEPWPQSRRVAFPGYLEAAAPVRKAAGQKHCQECFSPVDACECLDGPTLY